MPLSTSSDRQELSSVRGTQGAGAGAGAGAVPGPASRPTRRVRNGNSSGFEVGMGSLQEEPVGTGAIANAFAGVNISSSSGSKSSLSLDMPVLGPGHGSAQSASGRSSNGMPSSSGKAMQSSHTPLTPLRSPAVMPNYTQVSSSPSVAAGVPVLELIRKFEEEKILNRDDRLSLNEALYNPERREAVVKALQAIELGGAGSSRFAIRRLKAIIHQNGTGEVSSKVLNQHRTDGAGTGMRYNLEEYSSPVGTGTGTGAGAVREADASGKGAGAGNEGTEGANSSPNKSEGGSKRGNNTPSGYKSGAPPLKSAAQVQPHVNTQAAIEQVISTTPMYVNPENFNVCSKIARRLRDFLSKYKPSTMGVRKFAVLIGGGSFNPLTRMHLRAYFVAKQYLESQCGFVVLGSLLSPAHGMTVRERYRTNQKEILPSPHRLAIAQMLVKDSKWVSIDPWEITRRRPMDYLALIEHTHQMLAAHFPNIDFRVLYLAKANDVPKIAPAHLKALGAEVGVVSVCRAMDYDMVQASLSAKWNGLFHCVEDTAVLDSSLDVVTSRKVREKIRAGEAIAHLVGDNIDLYARSHHLGPKMLGLEEWSAEEKILPVAASRPQELLPRSNTSTVSTAGSGRTESGGGIVGSSLQTQDSREKNISINDSGVMNTSAAQLEQRGVFPLEKITEDGASPVSGSKNKNEDDDDDDDDSVGGSVAGGYGNRSVGVSKGQSAQANYEPSWASRGAEVAATGNVVVTRL